MTTNLTFGRSPLPPGLRGGSGPLRSGACGWQRGGTPTPLSPIPSCGYGAGRNEEFDGHVA
ncbi:hypothetical protein FZC33_19860 [Labrys sp. KNU-23]|nr:hypothetical protein FZC33_19860 [Labrys sp. KNU-23]